MIPYTAQITDEITGVLIAEELPCEIEVEVIGEDVRVEDVKVDGISLYKGTPLSVAVASQVAEKALADDDFIAKAMLTVHDPDAVCVRRVA